MGWGNFFDRVSKYFKTPEQSLRDKIVVLKRERDAILSEPKNVTNSARFIIVLDKLREAEERLANLNSSKG